MEYLEFKSNNYMIREGSELGKMTSKELGIAKRCLQILKSPDFDKQMTMLDKIIKKKNA
jgi:hypothetical protein